MASLITRFIATLSFLLLGAAPAWAGRGDIDPNYGEGGRLAAPLGVQLVLPGDRLVIADGGTGEGFRIRMVDAAGRNVPAFGDGGVALIDSSAAARTFLPEAAALAPNGDMIFVGSLSDTGARALLRLDNDGEPVLSFGNLGDGFVEPALTTAVMAIDPAGKIVLAEASSDPDSTSCGSTARLERLLANGQPDAEFGSDGIIEIPNLELCEGEQVLVFGARADGGVIVGDGHTILAVDAEGDIDLTFGVDGRLAVTELAQPRGLLLPDGGLLIFGSNTLTGSGDTVFLKFDRNGQPDFAFGPGTGSVTVDLGAAFQEVPSSREYVEQVALDPDGEHFVAQLHLGVSGGNGYARSLCSGIVRLSIDGTLDAGFGRNGLTCLNLGFALIGVQRDGAPLFFAGNDNSIHRLLPDSSPSPGFLRVVGAYGSNFLSESGSATVAIVERVAGRDGAVSVDYATVGRPELGYPATAGSDYIATSGRLEWASGDDGQRTVTVSILDDSIDEPNEVFGVDISEPGGSVQLIGASMSAVISDDDEASSTPPPPHDPPPLTGGGGSVSWATQLALLTLLYIRRRRVNRY